MNRTSSATTSAASASAAPSPAISRSAHGRPCAPRPTITAAAPVASMTRSAVSRSVMSPEATTGMPTRETSSAVSVWSAVPVYICWAERGCSVSEATPAASSMGPSVRAERDPLRTPRRIFTVTGTSTASTTAVTSAQARAWSSSALAPAPVFVTLRTGQPKLMSTMSAPAATTMCAASAIGPGSEPKICTASGCSSGAMRR